MKIAFANDHAALEMRNDLVEAIKEGGDEVLDFGSDSPESVDYPDMAEKAVRAVLRGEADRAVLVCGTGLGMSISANKFPGVRCALCTDEYAARLSREHNDANALALRGREMDLGMNRRILDIFLRTDFKGGRHQRRLDKITDIEKNSKEK